MSACNANTAKSTGLPLTGFRWLPVVLVLLSVLPAGTLQAQQPDLLQLFAHSVPLAQSGAGSFNIRASVGNVEDEFLLDTGASLVTVSNSLFRKIRKSSDVTKVRQVGARLASGKVEVLDVYRAERFVLGTDCELGPVEFAVYKRGGRNLLGMNALSQASPFAVSVTPPALGLSGCLLLGSQVSLVD